MRRALVVVAVVLGAVALASPARAASLPRMPLTHLPAGAHQVVIVHGRPGTTYAHLEAYQQTAGVWRRVLGPMQARLGRLGFSDHHVEGTPNTPTGSYPVGSTMYGIDPNPGARYPYHRLVSGDWWNERSGSAGYNTFHHGADPGGASEALWRIYPAYRYFIVINYNVPAVAGRGSAIFLHEGTGGPTAGCVSVSHDDLRTVMTWLDPAASPRIVLSSDGGLGRY